jgi:POT family proton-dependent oligopeptide transporter
MTQPESNAQVPAPFVRSFWTANITELFERGAYYSMASFVVIYLGRLGMGSYWPSNLNGLLWTLLYFLPILSGSVADQIGFRKSLIGAFVLLVAGYLLLGGPVWFGGTVLNNNPGPGMTASHSTWLAVAAAILVIGIGGSIVKPCISGTVQKTAAGRTTLAFAIFYMVINIGSLVGRGVAWLVRKRLNIGVSPIFAVATVFAVLGLLVVLLVHRDPVPTAEAISRPRRSPGRVLLDMVLVLKNPRFTLFLLVNSGFTFLYAQVYNVLPLYLKSVEGDPPVDIYTMANPLVIVAFQLAITRRFGRIRPIRSIVIGTVIIGLAMVINVAPLWIGGGPHTAFLGAWIPVGSVFIIATVALIALGELFAQARTYEYIGSLAPKGQEGLFLGYASLPMAVGALTGGPIGALVFNEIMCRNSVVGADKIRHFDPTFASAGWGLFMLVGFASAAGMWLYDRWIRKQDSAGAVANV